jgi:DNA-binding NtrC family response regulator
MRTALRLVTDNHSSNYGESSGQSPKSRNGAERKSTVLVVEDEVLVRLAVADFLRHSRFRVLEASNADEAKTILIAGEPVEVVFSDVNMPGSMNGFELAQWVRRQYPDVKVLLASGVDHIASHAGYGKEEGPVLHKPYIFDVVLTHIKRLLLR